MFFINREEFEEKWELVNNNFPNIFVEYCISQENPLHDGFKDVLGNFETFRDQVKEADRDYPRIRSSLKGQYKNDHNGNSYKDLLNFIEIQFPSKLLDIINENNLDGDTYKRNGVSNNGGMYSLPYFGVLKKNKTAEKGCYPVLGSKSFSERINNPQIDELKTLKELFRDIFLYFLNKNIDDLSIDLNISELEYNIDLIENSQKARGYQAGSIFAKEYSKEEIFSNEITEEELEKDFLDFVKIYEFAEKHKIFEMVEKISKFNPLDLTERVDIGENILLYGVPGSGKSYTIENEYCDDETITERILFHPDYTYSDFVGQILPKVSEEDQIEYKFTPGPFTSILEKAYKNPKQKYILIIEEINRGDAPAIFGDIFQLLDRKREFKKPDKDDGYPLGTSEYGITNPDIAYIVYDKNKEHEVRIPSNLSILATMNTSDQNVFTLDTAFKRRWTMRMIENSFDDNEFNRLTILDTGLLWKDFCEIINQKIVDNNISNLSSEDKRIGAYFVDKKDLGYMDIEKIETELKEKEAEQKIINAEIKKAELHNKKFAEKVLMYLWDDALKLSREEVFDVENLEEFTLEFIVKQFNNAEEEKRFTIFIPDIQKDFKEAITAYNSNPSPQVDQTGEDTESTENNEDSENIDSQTESTEVIEGSDDEQ